jgi:hypothetical protein
MKLSPELYVPVSDKIVYSITAMWHLHLVAKWEECAAHRQIWCNYVYSHCYQCTVKHTWVHKQLFSQPFEFTYILSCVVTVIISLFNSILCAGHLNKKNKCNKFSPHVNKKNSRSDRQRWCHKSTSKQTINVVYISEWQVENQNRPGS